MLSQISSAVRSSSNSYLKSIATLSLLLTATLRVAAAQNLDPAEGAGEISGAVFQSADNRPAPQVIVTLKSAQGGVSRSILTDWDGRFTMRGLPAGAYDVIAEEAGYAPAASRIQLNGSASNVVLHMRPVVGSHDPLDGATVSVRQLRIPAKATEEYDHGLRSLAKNELSGALKHFMKAANAYPSFYEAQYHVGVTQFRMGNREEAMRAFQGAVDLSEGRYAPAELGVGAILYEAGNSNEAEKIVRRALEIDDNSAEAYGLLAMVLFSERRTNEAEKSAREALLRKPTFTRAYLVLSDVHASRQEYSAQVQDLDAYLALAPNGPERARIVKARQFIAHKLSEKVLQAGIPER